MAEGGDHPTPRGRRANDRAQFKPRRRDHLVCQRGLLRHLPGRVGLCAHHFIEDNILTENGKPGETYLLQAEAYAGHFYPESTVAGCSTGPVIPGTYTDPLEGKLRAAMGENTFGIWNEEAYQLWMDVVTLTEVMSCLPESSLRAAKIGRALEKFTLTVDFEQPLEGRIASYKKGREVLKEALSCVNGSTAPTFYGIGNAIWTWPGCGPWRRPSGRSPAPLRPSCG